MEETRQLVNMKRLHVATQQVAQEMKRGVSDRIHCVQGSERKSVQDAALATLPESIETGRLELLRLVVPEPEMQFERNGNLGVEDIAPPFPSGLADHGRQMIHAAVRFPQRFVAKPRRDIAGAQQLVLWN